MLRRYSRSLYALGAGLFSASYRFVPLVNETFAIRADRHEIRLRTRTLRATQRARLNHLRHQLLARLALDRERRRIPRMKSKT